MNDKTELSPEEKAHLKRCDDINRLFDAVVHETGIREQEVFVRAYMEQVQEARVRFLKDVATCPKHVEEFCQRLLNERRNGN